MSNIVERLRSPANVFYEYAADNGAFLREAADEITRLRAELAAVTEERDRMRAALKPFAVEENIIHRWYSSDVFPYVPDDHPVLSNKITVGDLRAAAAALKETGDE